MVLVPLWVFRLKISTVGAIAAPFWVLCREKYLILFHRFVYITMNNRTEIYDNAFITFTSKRYSKQSPLSLFEIMRVSVNVLNC